MSKLKEHLHPNFSKSKILTNGYHLNVRSVFDTQTNNIIFEVNVYTNLNETVGWLFFKKSTTQIKNRECVEAYKVWIDPLHRGNRLAPQAYQFMESIGFTIKPNNVQTIAGKKMWTDMRLRKDLSMVSLGYINTAKAHVKQLLTSENKQAAIYRKHTHTLEIKSWIELRKFKRLPTSSQWIILMNALTELNDGNTLLDSDFILYTNIKNVHISASLIVALNDPELKELFESIKS